MVDADNEALLESVRIAIQAQEEIKQELLTELLVLEGDARPRQISLKTVQFYSSSLRHAVSEKSAVIDQVANFKASILPDLERQLERINSRRITLEKRVMGLQLSRNPAYLRDANSPEKLQATVAALSDNLTKELIELSTTETELKNSTAKARTELRTLQDLTVNKQRDSARITWQSEVADERKVNNSRFGRKRAATIVSSQQRPVRSRGMSVRIARPQIFPPGDPTGQGQGEG
jgi:hypothetical protein